MRTLKTIKFAKTRNVKTPARAHSSDAGIDFFCPEDLTVQDMAKMAETTGDVLDCKFDDAGYVVNMILRPGQSALIPSGIKAEIPGGYVLNFENKSGIASKRHLIFGSKVCDAGYQGVVHINLHNVGSHNAVISRGDKIAQALTYEIETPAVEIVESEKDLYSGATTARGEGGFGSSDALPQAPQPGTGIEEKTGTEGMLGKWLEEKTGTEGMLGKWLYDFYEAVEMQAVRLLAEDISLNMSEYMLKYVDQAAAIVMQDEKFKEHFKDSEGVLKKKYGDILNKGFEYFRDNVLSIKE